MGSLSGEFGYAMVRISASEPDTPPKNTKEKRLGIHFTHGDFLSGKKTLRLIVWLVTNLGRVRKEIG